MSTDMMADRTMTERRESRAKSFRLIDYTPLTEDNFAEMTRSLPRAVRRALGFVIGLEHGTLAITLPSGERFRIEGKAKSQSPTLKFTLTIS
jgi:hypothetical protein